MFGVLSFCSVTILPFQVPNFSLHPKGTWIAFLVLLQRRDIHSYIIRPVFVVARSTRQCIFSLLLSFWKRDLKCTIFLSLLVCFADCCGSTSESVVGPTLTTVDGVTSKRSPFSLAFPMAAVFRQIDLWILTLNLKSSNLGDDRKFIPCCVIRCSKGNQIFGRCY